MFVLKSVFLYLIFQSEGRRPEVSTTDHKEPGSAGSPVIGCCSKPSQTEFAAFRKLDQAENY